MKKDRIIVVALVVLILIFGVRGCVGRKHGPAKETAHKGATTDIQKNEKEGGTKSNEREMQKERPQEPAEKEEGQGDTSKGVVDGIQYFGYADTIKRVLGVDAESAVKQWRAWLDKNGRSSVSKIVFGDAIEIRVSEQKYSVDCQVVYGNQGNGAQPEPETLTMDYYKTRDMYQFHK